MLLIDAVDCPDRDAVLRWIRRAIKHYPLVLDICVDYFFGYQFQIPRLGSNFRRLKALQLEYVSLDPSFAERLNSGCPVLEDLVLMFCRNEFDFIQSDTLKNLDVRICSSQVADKLVVRAPCLTSLCLHFPCNSYKNGLSLEAGNSLVRACISVSGDQKVETIIVGSLFNVTSLELNGFGAMVCMDKEIDKFPIFDNLRTLSLNSCFFGMRGVQKFKALGRFLRKSPYLDKLILKNFWVRSVVGPIEFPIFEKLKTLFLDSCDLGDNFRILRLFLRSSPNFEKVTVRLCKLPNISAGAEGKTKATTMFSRFTYLARFKCRKLRSTEIIYEKGVKIQELVSFLLEISDDAPKNTITLTKI